MIPMKKPGKRIFGVTILFLMMVLAIGTMVTSAEERSNPYSLTIKKVFAVDKMTPEALAEAQKLTYNFRVEAQIKKGGENEYESVVKNVKIPDANGNWEVEIPFETAFKISVIEQTDNGEGNEYDVVETVCKSSMHVGASQASVNISKDGGEIEVTRPADVPDVTFRLTRKTSDGGSEIVGTDVVVKAGETIKLGDGLPKGEYTITKLRSEDGFSVLVGSRSFDVIPYMDSTGKMRAEGEVHINGSDSQLLITAPPQEGSVPRTHYYRILGPEIRDLVLKSGETGMVEHLTEGTYIISVSETYSGIKGYTVDFPVTTIEERVEYSNAMNYEDKRTYKGILVNNADYVEFYGFGPLYDGSGVEMDRSVTYEMNYGIKKPGATGVTRNKINGTCNAKGKYTLDNPKKLVPGDNRLYFAASNVSDTSAKLIKVKWREYTEGQRKKTVEKPNADGDVVEIDGRGWIILSKEADTDPLGQGVSYYYTITDSNGKKIENYTVTDVDGNPITVPTGEEGSTVTLKAGQSVKISNLQGENFRIKETIKSVDPMGFHVELKDTEKRVTKTQGFIDIEILGERSVEIRRPGKPEDDNSRDYTYNIYEHGKNEPVRTIKLKSGQSATVMEQSGQKLPPGKYEIRAMDDQIVGFDVAFSDSSSLTSDYIKEATVTFTNRIDKVVASYHVIHEYYLKEKQADGSVSYTFEGSSPVYTKNCDGNHNDKAGHFAKDVHLQDVHDGHTYTHIETDGDAYGKVVSWTTGDAEKEVPLEAGKDIVYSGPYMNDWRGKNEEGTYQYAYKPLTNLNFATALPHSEADKQGAQIIILRYVREETPEERGKYNIIHVYYRRTSEGDKWDGTSALETVDVGRLTNENRYKTYNAGDVEKKPRFTPGDVEYPYAYDGASYGRIVKSEDGDIPGESSVGAGQKYKIDDTMASVKATGKGDEIIILRYYRAGGYNVVHEYYYQKNADYVDGSGESGEEPDGTPEGGADSGDGGTTRTGENSVSANDPTENIENASGEVLTPKGDADGKEDSSGEIQVLAAGMETNASGSDVSGNDPSDPDSGEGKDVTQGGENDISGNDPSGADGDSDPSAENTVTGSENVLDEEMEFAFYSDDIQTLEGEYIYEFEGNRPIVPYSDKLESRHDAEDVTKEKIFQPAGSEQYTYVYKDAVYGYVDKDTGAYRMAPYKTGVTATASEDEIIILRYIRGEGVKEPEIPETPEQPDPPGDGGGGGGHDPDPTPPPVEPEIPEEPELPTELPDPNDPDSPDRITILEDGVPRTYVKVWDPDILQWIYIPEEEVPLWGSVPATGDESGHGFWMVLAAAAVCGAVSLKLTPQKKKDF